MKHEVVERLETLLRDEGFTNLTTLRASHDVTISATRGETRLVTHISERVSVRFPACRPTRCRAAPGGPAEAASARPANRSGRPVRAGPGEPTGPGRPGRTGPGRPM